MIARRSSLLAVILGGWIVLWLSTSSFAQGTLYTLLTNGPTAKRINIVVLSEGYTTNQFGQFLNNATNAVNNLLAAAPYQEYRNYFNAFAISVASAESGSDHYTPTTSLVNTYFNSAFDSYGIQQLITIPPNDRDSNSSHGQGKVDSLLQALMPEYDLVMMVVNDTQYGGSGGQTFMTSLNVDSAEIVRHESGHSFGVLTDEYEYSAPAGYVWAEYPNATVETNRQQIKWRSWILTNTPLPTPETIEFFSVVGLFEGAQYLAANWYRPKLECKMRSIASGTTTPFCDICSEQLVKRIYNLIRPIDAFLPVATNFSVYSTQAVAFSVTLLQPLTHNLSVQWFTNGTAITGATNSAFNLVPGSLGNGLHALKSVVSDTTSLVKNDPTGLLKATNTWNLTLSLNDLALVSAQFLSSNRFRLTVTGAAPQGFVLQASTNLVNWTSLTTNVLSGGKFDYTNSSLTNLSRRFYRTVSPP